MAEITLLVGSVYGTALETARDVAEHLEDLGHDVALKERPSLADLADPERALLICTSTTGQGELPASLAPLYVELKDQLPLQPGRPYGLIVLGDSSYGETYCGAGTLMEELMEELACLRIGEPLRIDAMETPDPSEAALPWVEDWVAALA